MKDQPLVFDDFQKYFCSFDKSAGAHQSAEFTRSITAA